MNDFVYRRISVVIPVISGTKILIAYFCHMKIEEAIVYCLATSNRGMRSEQIADMINRQRLYLRKDGQPVSAKQVYYVVSHNPDMFCFSLGRIMLMI